MQIGLASVVEDWSNERGLLARSGGEAARSARPIALYYLREKNRDTRFTGNSRWQWKKWKLLVLCSSRGIAPVALLWSNYWEVKHLCVTPLLHTLPGRQWRSVESRNRFPSSLFHGISSTLVHFYEHILFMFTPPHAFVHSRSIVQNILPWKCPKRCKPKAMEMCVATPHRCEVVAFIGLSYVHRFV